MENNNKKESIITTAITVITVIVIIVLAFLFYYYAEKNRSLGQMELASLSGYKTQSVNTSNFTKVINFQPSEVLPSTIMSGNCLTNSVAQPYRTDAFRCMVENSIYDPCFTTNQEGFVFCQMNPLQPESFLIKLVKPLPVLENLAQKQNNWAWFVKLKDGTYCSPYTGTRPFVDDKIAYYGCISAVEGETVVLIGDLIPGDIWKANKSVIVKDNKSLIIKSSEEVEIDSVWQ